MSRNKEKSQSGLNRYQNLKAKEAGVLESNPQLRPTYVQKCQNVQQAEVWRKTVLSEISTKLTKIQDVYINETEIREINDDLNKLFKEKRAWEHHIKNLGGNDYILNKNDMINSGLNVNGYRYFGRAKELADAKNVKKRKLSTEVKAKSLDKNYFGKYDDDDKELKDFEKQRSQVLQSKHVELKKIPKFPSNDEVSKYILDRKRKSLIEKLNLRNS